MRFPVGMFHINQKSSQLAHPDENEGAGASPDGEAAAGQELHPKEVEAASVQYAIVGQQTFELVLRAEDPHGEHSPDAAETCDVMFKYTEIKLNISLAQI